MAISGDQFRQIQDALLDAYRSKTDLEMMVKFGLSKNLDEITQGAC